MAKRCKHKICCHGYDVEVCRCLDCNEYLSLGPARIAPEDAERIGVELRLAERLADNAELWEPGSGRNKADEECIDAALRGLDRVKECDQCKREDCNVAYWQYVVDNHAWRGVATSDSDARMTLTGAMLACSVWRMPL